MDKIEKKLDIIEDVIINPRGEIPLHSHKFTEEIFFIRQNHAIMTVDNNSFKVQEGDVVFVNKGESHGFKNLSNDEVKLICLKINHKKGDSFLG